MSMDERHFKSCQYELMSGGPELADRVPLAGRDTGLFRVDRPGVAWDWMAQTGLAPNRSDWVRPQVAEAWGRCVEAYGLTPGARRLTSETAAEADHARLAGAAPGASARAILANIAFSLKSLLRDASVTLLMADPAASLIHVMDAGLVLGPAGRRLAALGARWQESTLGNNGLGTAAVLREAVAFDGKEHFAFELHPYATVGQPIFGYDGGLTALLGLMTDRRDSASALLCFLRLAGHLIEASLFEQIGHGGATLRLRPAGFSAGVAVEDCLLDGLLAVDEAGAVAGATRAGLALLGLDRHSDILRKPLKAVLGVQLQDLSGPESSQTAFEVRAPNSRLLIVQLMGGREARETPRRGGAAAEALRGNPRQLSVPARASGARRRAEQWRDAVLETALQKALSAQKQKIAILITGESGVGKDHLVRLMHAAGPRRDGPFVLVNCAAIPRDLISSELFGYEAGSFTGARQQGKSGKFLDAHTGTLFLDEIGDMPFDLQAALLCTLDTSEIVPVGGARPVAVNVQVVAATNSQLQDCVRKGAFRRDLYYRLNGAQIWLPPLRERPDKLGLAVHLWEEESRVQGKGGGVFLSNEALDIFEQHPWPGNIRELRNVLRSCMATMTGPHLRAADLPDDFLDEMGGGADAPAEEAEPPDSLRPDRIPAFVTGELVEYEARAIRSALASTRGNISESARMLGITRATLYRKMARHGLKK